MDTFYVPASHYLSYILEVHNLPPPHYLEGVDSDNHFICHASVVWLSTGVQHEVGVFIGQHPDNPIIAKDLAAIGALRKLMEVHNFNVIDFHHEELLELKSRSCDCQTRINLSDVPTLNETFDIDSFLDIPDDFLPDIGSEIVSESFSSLEDKGKQPLSPSCEASLAYAPPSPLHLNPEIFSEKKTPPCCLDFATGATVSKDGAGTVSGAGPDYMSELINLRAIVKQTNKERIKMHAHFVALKLRNSAYQQGRGRFMRLGRNFIHGFNKIAPPDALSSLMRLCQNFISGFKKIEETDAKIRYNPGLQVEQSSVDELLYDASGEPM